ncbi:cytochrome P450 9c1-like [Teleopsis dalmanni]|uniref:cytochrome P450 9c1-like n=1 Tax=Teleopsis dalmanni TaxID=139649 RepID=UPI0018CEE399|nr:cytochrome P450 9c1-like [Teleopsis dalmanni]
MALIESLILISVVLYLIYKWSTANYNVLRERGVPHEKPFPLIGNVKWSTLRQKSSFLDSILGNYQKYNNCKVYGIYNFREPIIFLRDLELIKKVGVKDFDHFTNHKSVFTEAKDNVFSKSLIALENQKWKEMRNTLTPSFTGSKMRLMFELINDCSIQGIKYLEKQTKATDNNELDLEMKEYFTKFTNDIIASAAFGIKVDSFEDPDNEFYKIGQSFTKFRGIFIMKAFFISLFPKIARFLRMELMSSKMTNYFKTLVFGAMKYRAENNIIRPDMIQLLTEAKKHFEEMKNEQTGEHAEFNDDDLLAQCILFFLAGFETVSTCLCFTAHELLENQDVQDLLYQEVLKIEKELDGKPLNYDTIVKMKYMDMVLSESLRKWPPAIMLDRVCENDYKLTDEDGNLIVEIKKKDMIAFPIAALHRDPEYFPEPDKFQPERFSDENKSNIKHLSYLPFGIGPRSCIANRLALMETKAIIYHMLLRFKIDRGPKTTKDMMKSMKGFFMEPEELFWMKFIPRES